MLATSILAGHNQISRSARNLLAQHSTILKSVHAAARQYQHLTSAHCCNSSPPNHPTTSSPLKSCHVLCSSPHSCKQLNGTRRFNSIRQQVHKQQRKVSWGTQSWTDKDLSNLLSAKRAISTSAWRSNPRGVNQRSGRRHEEILEEEESDRETDVAKEEEADTRTRPHVPVMANEVLDALEPDENQVFLDMTFGAGGHTEVILQHCDTCRVLALDRDPVAYELATKMADQYGHNRLIPMLGRFSDLAQLLQENNVSPGSLDGVLIDAGSSSMQFDTAERGFALSKNGPLDMRMDGNRIANQPTAADVVNSLDAPTLTNILLTYGEESKAKRIAQTIVQYRQNYRPIETTKELATVVSFAFTHREADKRQDSLGRHASVATKTFLALRIFVNNELNELSTGLKTVEPFVRPDTGKLAVLSFHSMEDRIVKRFMQGRNVAEKAKTLRQRVAEGKDMAESIIEGGGNKWRMGKSVLTPSEEEIGMNPRSRSAKLRVGVKV